jgi:Lon protease-like protein
MIGTELPLFPLPVVLFPGTVQLLHIFEPRYREMLRDCLADDSRFGLTVVWPDRSPGLTPTPGDVGCRALIKSHHPLPDGRSNILTVGEERYVIKELVNRDRPYHVALVDYFHDDPATDPAITRLTQNVRTAFAKLTEMLGSEMASASAAELPGDPEALSFHVAAAVNTELSIKEEMLRLTSPGMRLERLLPLLHSLIAEADRRTRTRRVAKHNGKASQPPTLSAE